MHNLRDSPLLSQITHLNYNIHMVKDPAICGRRILTSKEEGQMP